MDLSRIKYEVRESLTGRFGALALYTLVYFIIHGALAYASTFLVIGPFIVNTLLAFGYILGILKLLTTRENDFGILFKLFTNFNQALNLLIAKFLYGFFIILGIMLFILPGIYFLLSSKLLMYVFLDNPEINAIDAIRETFRLADGNRLKLLLLDLLFIPEFLLIIITFGIYTIWFLPQYTLTLKRVYERLGELS